MPDPQDLVKVASTFAVAEERFAAITSSATHSPRSKASTCRSWCSSAAQL
jgi:hypothetical protein